MKKIIIIGITGLFIGIACKKKKEASIVVTVPKMTLIGPSVVTTSPTPGGTFTDLGINFTDESGSVTFLNNPTTSNVNISTPGFYSVTYARRTQYGYDVKASRYVLVTNVPAAEDYSGTYIRTANGVAIDLVKLGTGLYYTENLGGTGSSSTYINALIGKINDSVLVIPPQVSESIGDFSGKDGKLTISGNDTILRWRVTANGFGTAIRTFIK